MGLSLLVSNLVYMQSLVLLQNLVTKVVIVLANVVYFIQVWLVKRSLRKCYIPGELQILSLIIRVIDTSLLAPTLNTCLDPVAICSSNLLLTCPMPIAYISTPEAKRRTAGRLTLSRDSPVVKTISTFLRPHRGLVLKRYLLV